MNHKAKYVIEVSDGKYLKSVDGKGVSVSDIGEARRFRTVMEAEIFANVHGGLEALRIDGEEGKEYPQIVEK